MGKGTEPKGWKGRDACLLEGKTARQTIRISYVNPLSLLQQRSSTRLENTSPSADVALRFFLEYGSAFSV